MSKMTSLRGNRCHSELLVQELSRIADVSNDIGLRIESKSVFYKKNELPIHYTSVNMNFFIPNELPSFFLTVLGPK